MSDVIRLPKMRRDAEVRSSSYDESDNSVEVVFTTGATGRRVSWFDGEFDEELVVNSRSVRLDRLNEGAPFLDTHARWTLANVIGSVVRGSAKIEGGKGIARVKLSRAESAADSVSKIIEGTVSAVSVGYRIHAVEKKERDGAVPLHRVIDWEPMEISAVPVPFDAGAQVRGAEDDALFSCRVDAVLSDINRNRRARMEMALRTLNVTR